MQSNELTKLINKKVINTRWAKIPKEEIEQLLIKTLGFDLESTKCKWHEYNNAADDYIYIEENIEEKGESNG